MKNLKTILGLALLVTTEISQAKLIREDFEGVRPTGMGNAFLALADDANAIWYNPAALARVEQVHFNLINTVLGADSTDTLKRLNNAVFKSDFPNLIREDKEYLRLGILPTLVVPNFGVTFFEHAHGLFDLGGLTTTGVDIYSHNDVGVMTAGALSFGEYLAVGASARVMQRTGVDLTLSPTEILELVGTDLSSFRNNMYGALKDAAGYGYGVGLNAGVLVKAPLMNKGKNAPKLMLAATADNIGNTTFRKLGSDRVPTAIKQSYNFGTALIYPISKGWVWNTTLDLRHQLEAHDFVKQVHFGTEFRNRYFGIRGGVNQGYGTFGFSIEFPPHTRLHFSSYGVELGNSGWQRQHRWYLLQLVIGFNPI